MAENFNSNLSLEVLDSGALDNISETFEGTNLALAPLYKSNSFLSYVKMVNQIPNLTDEEELFHAKKVANEKSIESAQLLVSSYLKMVVKVATSFRNYGINMQDLVSEGNIGLMHAVKKFDPNKGFKLSTYAVWWIKAFIQEYILRSWSMVKICTKNAHRKLFFNLKKIKDKLAEASGNYSQKFLSEDNLKQISNDLGVSREEVSEMNNRLENGDTSINIRFSDDSDAEIGDSLESNIERQDVMIERLQNQKMQRIMIKAAMERLTDREKDILVARKLSGKVKSLDELSKIYSLSKERIRQIEQIAITKMRDYILSGA